MAFQQSNALPKVAGLPESTVSFLETHKLLGHHLEQLERQEKDERFDSDVVLSQGVVDLDLQ